uniref:basic salivary proline-rich protein 3-like n=1 Tax=Macaca mulatta TaxID=9544 RepID=UPI0010A21C80|nr:basic salivary proline-rich protein 3-like [Macaca mulatta]
MELSGYPATGRPSLQRPPPGRRSEPPPAVRVPRLGVCRSPPPQVGRLFPPPRPPGPLRPHPLRRRRRGSVERPRGARCPPPRDIALEAEARGLTAAGSFIECLWCTRSCENVAVEEQNIPPSCDG